MPPPPPPPSSSPRLEPIQPVARRFPASPEALEDSNLPFSCVVTPLARLMLPPSEAEASLPSSEERGGGEARILLEEEEEGEGEGEDQRQPRLPTLSAVPKCPRCGAPHADGDEGTTHYNRRPDPYSYAFPPSPSPSFRLCYLCGGVTAASASAHARAAEEEDEAAASSSRRGGGGSGGGSEAVVRLPLRLGGGIGGGNGASSGASFPPPPPPPPARYSVPAAACPLLWFVVLDGSCQNPRYWRTVSSLLLDALEGAPDHVSLSLLAARCAVPAPAGGDGEDDGDEASDGAGACRRTVGVWQLSSPVPTVLHYAFGGDEDDEEDEEEALALLSESIADQLVPASCPHILAALRGLVDYSLAQCEGGGGEDDGGGGSAAAAAAPPCGPDPEGAVRAVLDALADARARPAGRAPGPTGGDDEDEASPYSPPPLPYAGGKITVLLAGPPAPILRSRRGGGDPAGRGEGPALPYSPGAGGPPPGPPSSGFSGGAGGRIMWGRRAGERYRPSPGPDAADASAAAGGPDWSPRDLRRRYPRLDPGLPGAVSDLGRACAGAALGVDLLCLADPGGGGGHGGGGDDEENEAEEDPYGFPPPPAALPDFGLCWYAALSTRSGAPGPVLLRLPSSPSKEDPDRLALRRELESRLPWNPRLAFGGELRVRLSPGFAVDESAVAAASGSSPGGGRPPPPACYHRASHLGPDRGLFGPACSVDESPHLWRLGVSDPFTSYCVDLRANPSQLDPERTVRVDGVAEPLAMPPVVQTCFAYTAVVKDDEFGEHQTVRLMRIHSLPVGPLCADAEDLYASLDPEALALVLLHKLALASYQDGIADVPAVAEDWLASTLACAYRSAERRVARGLRGGAEHEGDRGRGRDPGAPPAFFPNERLLDRAGELSAEQVLLAQGHGRLRSLPLMAYLVMNCDAFRYGAGDASLDLRQAALGQMQCVTANTLTRCVAPRVQLWSAAKSEREPILDVVDLRAESVTMALEEYSQYDLVLFIDTPYMIAVVDAQYWIHHRPRPNGSSDGASGSDQNGGANSDEPPGAQTSLPLVLGPALRRSVADAASSYRAAPPVRYELDYSPGRAPRAVGLLLDVLAEDAPCPAAGCASFDAWKSDVAAGVRESLGEG